MNSYSLEYIDDLYVQYVRDPSSVSETWRQYFEQFLLVGNTTITAAPSPTSRSSQSRGGASQGSENTQSIVQQDNFSQPGPLKHETGSSDSVSATGTPAGHINTEEAIWLSKIQDRVNNLVREYRVRGHLIADLDPLGFPRPDRPNLSPEVYGLSKEDLQRPFQANTLEDVMGGTLDAILTRLHNTYCRSIGAQFMHIDRRNIRDWLQRRMETTENRLELSHEVQRRIYARLADATIFEEFVRRKFVGAKTFSLEGAETLIPMLDLALEKAGQHNVKEVIMGMAHRGRLNVMANILKKRAMNIFWSFDDPDPESSRGGGDVRYHLGYSSDWKTASGDSIHISLCFNPSHLEFVNTVAQGRTRCKQDRMEDDRGDAMTILIHGDAAFAGEGVVQETLNLSELLGYRTGGTLHIVVNNQVGFTTEPKEGRSTTYATDIAKMLQVPIFHVNGEDPEAVAQVVSLAMDFRKEFHRDVVIDLYAYRRWGHNEGDEPRFTQPVMYNEIDRRDSVRQQYLNRLLKLGEISAEEAEEIQKDRTEKLESEFAASKNEEFVPDTQTLAANWSDYYGGPEPTEETDTSVELKRLGELIDSLTRLPRGFASNKKLKRPMTQRREMAAGKKSLDWATAEAAAFASLLASGHPIRMTGQDCERGTFSQRHAVLHDTKSGEAYTPLKHVSDDQASLQLFNSPLSEAGVLGFEYGYSLDNPDGLTIWEAQFGDFWNCAQVIVDQFIASAEDKWNRLSGLVMLLPHGFEGQGPEHCSARPERFLAMAAEQNIQVVQPTTPAQYFHVLRRQVIRKWRKPLIVLTPKSLLRHPKCISPLEIVAGGSFKKILPDRKVPLGKAKRLLMCTGKVYYDLLAARSARKAKAKDVAIMRIEQLYPLSIEEIMTSLNELPEGTDIAWVQEEPTNMGAWPYLKLNFIDEMRTRYNVHRVSRVESASPSTGSMAAHKLEQADLMENAFGDLE